MMSQCWSQQVKACLDLICRALQLYKYFHKEDSWGPSFCFFSSTQGGRGHLSSKLIMTFKTTLWSVTSNNGDQLNVMCSQNLLENRDRASSSSEGLGSWDFYSLLHALTCKQLAKRRDWVMSACSGVLIFKTNLTDFRQLQGQEFWL